MADSKLENIEFCVFPEVSKCYHHAGQALACQTTLQRTPLGVPLSSSYVEYLVRNGGGWMKMVSSISKDNFSRLLCQSHLHQEAWMHSHHHNWFLWVSYLSLYVVDNVTHCCPCALHKSCGVIGQARPQGVLCYNAILKTCAQQSGVVRGLDLFHPNGKLRHGMVPMKYKNAANVYVPFLVVDANVRNMFKLFDARYGDSYASNALSLHWFFGNALPMHVFPIDEDSKVNASVDVCTSKETIASWSEVLAMVYGDMVMGLINSGRSEENQVENLCVDAKTQHSMRIVNGGKERKLSMHHHLRIQSSRFGCKSNGVCFAFDGAVCVTLSRSLVGCVQRMDMSDSSVLYIYKQLFGSTDKTSVDDNLYNHTATLRSTTEAPTKSLVDVHQIDSRLDLCPVYSPPGSIVCVLGKRNTQEATSVFGRRVKRARASDVAQEGVVEEYAKHIMHSILGDRYENYMNNVFSVIDSYVDESKDFHFFVVRLPNIPVLCAEHAKNKKCCHSDQHYALRLHGNSKNLTWRLVCWDNACKMSQLNWSNTKKNFNSEWQNLIDYVPSGVIDRDTLNVKTFVCASVV
jgi:hypothetical protein